MVNNSMSIAGTVVEIRDNTGERALGRLAKIPHVSIYGIKGERIVAVVEGPTPKTLDDAIKSVALLDEVIRVYPVYVADDSAME